MIPSDVYIDRLAAQIECERLREQVRDLSSRIDRAMVELEDTRWYPELDVQAWGRTRDGQNHRRVMGALHILRGLTK